MQIISFMCYKGFGIKRWHFDPARP